MHTVVFLRLCLGVHIVAQVKHEVAGLKLVDAAGERAHSLLILKFKPLCICFGVSPADADGESVELVRLVPRASGEAEVVLGWRVRPMGFIRGLFGVYGFVLDLNLHVAKGLSDEAAAVEEYRRVVLALNVTYFHLARREGHTTLCLARGTSWHTVRPAAVSGM